LRLPAFAFDVDAATCADRHLVEDSASYTMREASGRRILANSEVSLMDFRKNGLSGKGIDNAAKLPAILFPR
jgi:hypothetical protein